MFKFLLILALGIAIGYGYGWRDAQTHQKNAVERLLDGIGGETRGFMKNDIDSRFQTGDTK